VRWLPCGDVSPMKVIAVCIPYILVKDQYDEARTLDTRRYDLVQVSDAYARKAYKNASSKRKMRKRKRKRKHKCKK